MFQEFSKIARLSREVVITEKIDGTNAQIIIGEIDKEYAAHALAMWHNADGTSGAMYAASRTRLIKPGDDNYGFAGWVAEHSEELKKLGPGRHFGEWWGKGIQRNYGMNEKIFSLFNVHKWADDSIRPVCCRVVPTVWRGIFNTEVIEDLVAHMKDTGSYAAPGFMKPEGVVIFHTAAGHLYKKTIEKDEQPKGRTT